MLSLQAYVHYNAQAYLLLVSGVAAGTRLDNPLGDRVQAARLSHCISGHANVSLHIIVATSRGVFRSQPSAAAAQCRSCTGTTWGSWAHCAVDAAAGCCGLHAAGRARTCPWNMDKKPGSVTAAENSFVLPSRLLQRSELKYRLRRGLYCNSTHCRGSAALDG
jgi:hypothetical protein